MKGISSLFLATVCLYWVGAYPSQAQQSKSSLPFLGSASDTQEAESASRDSSMFGGHGARDWFRMPPLPSPSWPTPPGFTTVKEKTSSSWRQARRTTRRWWNNTVDFLTPDEPQPAAPADRPSSSRWWWFGQEPEEPEIATVNEFLRQERPRF